MNIIYVLVFFNFVGQPGGEAKPPVVMPPGFHSNAACEKAAAKFLGILNDTEGASAEHKCSKIFPVAKTSER